MNSPERVDWSSYEDYISEMLVYRESAELVLCNKLMDSDLHGASIASLNVALASLALGDRIKFNSYVLQATFLSEADIIFESENILREATEASSTPQHSDAQITVPEYFKADPEVQEEMLDAQEKNFQVYGWKRELFWLEDIKTLVRNTIEDANTTLQIESLSTDVEVNESLRDAVTEIRGYISMVSGRSDKVALLNLGYEIASRLKMDSDIDDLGPAVEAWAVLSTSTLEVSGNTLSLLNQALSAFKHLSSRFGNETMLEDDNDFNFEEYSLAYLHVIRQARRQIIGRSAYLPLKWIANDYYLTGAASPTKGERTRPNHSTQKAAINLRDKSLYN
jgi:hypothetical protein